ncbi:TolC family protein, partial [Vibrio parahaemolyticus]
MISLTAGYSDTQTRSPMQQPHTRGSSIGVGVTLPLFAGGGINSQVREA